MHELSPAALREILETAEIRPLLVDVREPWEFEICRLEDALLVPLRQLPALVDEWDREQDITLICHHGVRSRLAGQYLEQCGFECVFNLSGGLAAWTRDVDPALPTY